MNIGHNYKQKLVIAALLLLLTLSAQLFGQTASSLSGTVTDASQAVLSGATVTAVNDATGVKASTTTNNAGIYNLASLQPGTYKVTVTMTGFQSNTKTDVALLGGPARLNFELAVAGVATQIEVQSSAQDMILESSSSTGTVLQEKTMTALPTMNNDVMDLINVMGGVVRNEGDSVFGASTQTFGGIPSGDINITRDGITVSDPRYQGESGIVSPGRLNPDAVGEFKLILSPVDAEMGRGAGQVQVLTKSGTNAFHGSGVWNILNTGMDANEWNNNRTDTIPNYRNANDYTITVGGPVIKNKTFFFATWDQQIVRQRMTVRAPVLTNCARKGIYRYFSGWEPGNTQAITTTGFNSNMTPSVDVNGNPVVPATNVNGTPYSGTGNIPSIQGLNAVSVLGQLTPASLSELQADPINCSQFPALTVGGANGVVPGSNWDPYRKAYDQTGYISRFTNIMPLANDFYGGGVGAWGDGLNVADLDWTRTTPGQDTVYGTGEDNQRKAITFKLDHNVSEKHRLSGTFSYETDNATCCENTWPMPDAYPGSTTRKPIVFTAAFTSTLRPTLLNEFRAGLAYNESHNLEPTAGAYGSQETKLLQQLMPTTSFPNWSGQPVVIGPGYGGTFFGPDTFSEEFAPPFPFGFQPTFPSGPYGSRTDLEAAWGDHDYRWTFADSVTWTKGSHSFKGGVEYRLTHANADMNGWAQFTYSSNTFPYVQGGESGAIAAVAPTLGKNAGLVPGLVGGSFFGSIYDTGSAGGLFQLMDYMAGTISTIRQFYFVNSPTAQTWNNPSAGQNTRHILGRQNEMSAYLKDDWKVSQSLTLNLGVRWEYYGVPWIDGGMTVGLVGGAQSIFGGSPGGFSEWMQNPVFNPNNLTTQQFIGPGSPNPNQSAYNKDLGAFGPAVGFAWQLPWFGKGKTTLRGGYQISYIPIANSDPNGGYEAVIGNVPGTIYPESFSGDPTFANNGYMDLTQLPQLLPVGQIVTNGNTISGAIPPLSVRPVTDRSQTFQVYDPNIRDPYIQNLTMALTRNVTTNLTVDVRYIGTLSRKLIGTDTLNSPNWINNGLLNAFNIARAGGESTLLNQIIAPGTLQPGVALGADQLRASFYSATDLATGQFASLAGVLATTNGFLPLSSTIRGGLLRASGTPENFIFQNPQFSAANWISNLDNANYHSLQAQVTLRPTHNINFQSSYTWSKNLGYNGAGTDPLDRSYDYGLLSTNRTNNWTTYGTYTLPFGRNGYLFRDSSKAVKKIVEGWQLSWIDSIYSGMPGSLANTGAPDSMWGGPMENLVMPSLFNRNSGHVTWANGAIAGYYFGQNKFMQVTDPQCSQIAASLAATCASSLHALAQVASINAATGLPVAGPIVLAHADPGTPGNFQTNTLVGFGRWTWDMTAGKSIDIAEGKSLTFRMDAQDVLNHPTPSGTLPYSYDNRIYATTNPVFDIGSTTQPFGYIPYKGGHRVFSAKIRLAF